MDPRLSPLCHILELNTRLYLNCFADVSTEAAVARPNEHCNSMVFLGLHLVDSRHYLAAQVGAPCVNPVSRYGEGFNSIADMPAMPSVDELRPAWTAISSQLKEALGSLGAGALDAPTPVRFPIADSSVMGVIAFLVQHDSYHVGQLALLRKYVGLPAMTYR